MDKIKILLTDRLVERMPEIAADRYPEEASRIEWVLAESGDEEELVRLAADVDIIVGARKGITGKVLGNAHKVRFIQQAGKGYDNIDFEAVRRKGITVSNAGGAGVIPVAEHTIMLMLAVAKSLPRAHNSVVRGEWLINEFVAKVYEIYERMLGIIGLGQIGTQVAVLANGLKMKVQYYDPHRKETSDLNFPIKSVSLEELLKTSDFVSINCLLTEETFHLIGKNELRMMKPTAYLINTSRGAVVDEDALADALEEGWIAGAGLDVFGGHIDPPPKGSKILNLPNVVFTPHTAGFTDRDLFRTLYITSLDNIIRVVRNEKPLFVLT
ncbi:MAG: NAD(P)-dependent oxidoreductase [Pseudomonadota bacterium]